MLLGKDNFGFCNSVRISFEVTFLEKLDFPITFLKVLTHKSFLFRIRFYTPKGLPKYAGKNLFPKKELENDFETCAEVSPMSDGWDPPP